MILEKIIPFFSPKRAYHGDDVFFDRKMDFSWHIKILGNFFKPATLAKFSMCLENPFFYQNTCPVYVRLFLDKKGNTIF